MVMEFTEQYGNGIWPVTIHDQLFPSLESSLAPFLRIWVMVGIQQSKHGCHVLYSILIDLDPDLTEFMIMRKFKVFQDFCLCKVVLFE